MAVALRAGVCGRATFDFVLRCDWAWAGRATHFVVKSSEKLKISAKLNFSAELGGIEAEMCRDGRVVAQRNGKLRARLSFRVRACTATAVFLRCDQERLGDSMEVWKIVGMTIGLYVGGFGCSLFF